MKIAIICFNFSWQSGGPRLIFSMAQALKAKGHAVKLYAPEFSGKYYKELWQGLDIITVPVVANELLPKERPRGFFAWAYGKVRREFSTLRAAQEISKVMDSDFDILNVHDFSYPTAYFYKRRNPRAMAIWTENDPPYAYLPKDSFVKSALARLYHFWKDFSARKYFKAIDAVSVLDAYNERWCRVRGLRAHITRLGVDFEKFYLPVKDFSQRAAEKKISIFGLGSLNQHRRYEDLILAVKFLRDYGYNASAIIIASDQWNESKYREKILTLVKNNRLEDFVTFNFNGVSEEGLRNVYNECDVFVYAMYVPPPRNGFGFSIGVFEAMAAGLPVILCHTTTSTEVLKDGETALFIGPMSPEQIAEKVRFLLDNPEIYQTIAAAGQKLVKEELTWGKYTERFLNIVSSLK